MKLKRVLVVYKKSTFQLQAVEHKETRFLQLLEDKHAVLAKVQVSHNQHYQTVATLENILKARNISYDMVVRADLTSYIADYDLVISVGGDGTFLDASHSILDTPIVGINSAPSSSFGHFCLGTEQNIEDIFTAIESGQCPSSRLLRLVVSINGKQIPELILNEALIAHINPAGTSRYLIEMDGTTEEHRSSGIWVGPPAGSTGALKSAGGQILPITDSFFQYVVREPWTRPGQVFRHTKGVLPRQQSLRLFSQMRTASVYIDGQHIAYPLSLGDELTISVSPNDLQAYINPDINNIFLA